MRILTSSWVLPCCSFSHCSRRAVSSALESTLADTDAMALPVMIWFTFEITWFIHPYTAVPFKRKAQLQCCHLRTKQLTNTSNTHHAWWRLNRAEQADNKYSSTPDDKKDKIRAIALQTSHCGISRCSSAPGTVTVKQGFYNVRWDSVIMFLVDFLM